MALGMAHIGQSRSSQERLVVSFWGSWFFVRPCEDSHSRESGNPRADHAKESRRGGRIIARCSVHRTGCGWCFPGRRANPV